jgi:PhnB protein
MEFYKSCFGGELAVTKVGESPAKDFMPASMHDKVVYAQLKSGSIDISASDWLMPSQKPVRGNTVCLFLSRGTKQELKGFFAKLSEGAEITDPLRDEFHGLYGALNDKFGVRWMFQTDSKE